MFPNTLSDRLRMLRWVVPPTIAFFAALYQIVLARYVHERFGDLAHYSVEVILYAMLCPIIIWFVLRTVHVWAQQKEQAEADVHLLNAELQKRVDERTSDLQAKADALVAANEHLEELDRLKSEFISLVSHELRAPLTNVRGAVELMGADCANLNPTCSRMFDVVYGQIGRLGRLVDDVLNVSRIESGSLAIRCTSVDVGQVADRVVDGLTAHGPSHVFRRLGGTLGRGVWADGDRVYQVLANLVDNATKYSPPHSEVILETRAEGQVAVISVTDCGPGIPEEEHDRIFEKFHRLDSGDAKETYGYGLGLYVCRRLVEAMNGRIWVESEPGNGATFRFTLPLVTSST